MTVRRGLERGKPWVPTLGNKRFFRGVQQRGTNQIMSTPEYTHFWAMHYFLTFPVICIPKWPATPVFLPAKSHGQRSLAGYSPWGHKELDTTEWVTLGSHVYLTAICWARVASTHWKWTGQWQLASDHIAWLSHPARVSCRRMGYTLKGILCHKQTFRSWQSEASQPLSGGGCPVHCSLVLSFPGLYSCCGLTIPLKTCVQVHTPSTWDWDCAGQ